MEKKKTSASMPVAIVTVILLFAMLVSNIVLPIASMDISKIPNMEKADTDGKYHFNDGTFLYTLPAKVDLKLIDFISVGVAFISDFEAAKNEVTLVWNCFSKRNSEEIGDIRSANSEDIARIQQELDKEEGIAYKLMSVLVFVTSLSASASSDDGRDSVDTETGFEEISVTLYSLLPVIVLLFFIVCTAMLIIFIIIYAVSGIINLIKKKNEDYEALLQGVYPSKLYGMLAIALLSHFALKVVIDGATLGFAAIATMAIFLVLNALHGGVRLAYTQKDGVYIHKDKKVLIQYVTGIVMTAILMAAIIVGGTGIASVYDFVEDGSLNMFKLWLTIVSKLLISAVLTLGFTFSCGCLSGNVNAIAKAKKENVSREVDFFNTNIGKSILLIIGCILAFFTARPEVVILILACVVLGLGIIVLFVAGKPMEENDEERSEESAEESAK